MVVPTKAASRPRLNKTSVTVIVGYSTTLKVSGTNKKVKWSSSNSKIATVSNKGKITGKKSGSTTITAKAGSIQLKCKVQVKNNSWKGPKNATYSGIGYHANALYYSNGKLVCDGFLHNANYNNTNFYTLRVRIYADNKLLANGWFSFNTTVRARSTKNWKLLFSKGSYNKLNLGAVKNVSVIMSDY